MAPTLLPCRPHPAVILAVLDWTRLWMRLPGRCSERRA